MTNLTDPNHIGPKFNPSEKKILIIDDDDDVRKMLQVQLEVEGFQIKAARDGKQVVSLTLQFQPDLIVSDIMMPGAGGYDVLRALQSDVNTRKTPVLLISGGRFDKSTKDMMRQEPNVVGYFDKPLHIPAFLLKVHTVLHTKTRDERLIEERQRFGDTDVTRYGF